MITFHTQINGEPCLCRVFSYSPATETVITGSGYGDCEEGESEEFNFKMLNGNYEFDSRLTKAADKHVQRLIEEYLFEQEYEYRNPYQ